MAATSAWVRCCLCIAAFVVAAIANDEVSATSIDALLPHYTHEKAFYDVDSYPLPQMGFWVGYNNTRKITGTTCYVWTGQSKTKPVETSPCPNTPAQSCVLVHAEKVTSTAGTWGDAIGCDITTDNTNAVWGINDFIHFDLTDNSVVGFNADWSLRAGPGKMYITITPVEHTDLQGQMHVEYKRQIQSQTTPADKTQSINSTGTHFHAVIFLDNFIGGSNFSKYRIEQTFTRQVPIPVGAAYPKAKPNSYTYKKFYSNGDPTYFPDFQLFLHNSPSQFTSVNCSALSDGRQVRTSKVCSNGGVRPANWNCTQVLGSEVFATDINWGGERIICDVYTDNKNQNWGRENFVFWSLTQGEVPVGGDAYLWAPVRPGGAWITVTKVNRVANHVSENDWERVLLRRDSPYDTSLINDTAGTYYRIETIINSMHTINLVQIPYPPPTLVGPRGPTGAVGKDASKKTVKESAAGPVALVFVLLLMVGLGVVGFMMWKRQSSTAIFK